MIQKRRKEFKAQIRKRQITEVLMEKRTKVLEFNKLEEYRESLEEGSLSKDFSSTLESIYINIKHQDKESFDKLIHHLISEVEKSPADASFCLIIQSKSLKNILTKIINNRQIISEGVNEWQKIQFAFQCHVVSMFFDLLSMLQFNYVKEMDITQLVQGLIDIFLGRIIDVQAEENQFILLKALKVFHKMLSFNNQIVYRTLKEFRLLSQLQEIIKVCKGQSILELLEILNAYFMQQKQYDKDQKSEIEGIDIIGVDVSQRMLFINFICGVIKTKNEKGILLALDSLIIIFDRYSFLANQIFNSIIGNIAQLVAFPSLPIQKKATVLICDMLTEQQQQGCLILKKNILFDVLYTFLQAYSHHPDDKIKQYSYVVCCIISNLTLLKDKLDLEPLFKHKIWKLALQNIQINSPLFPLVGIFEYYFQFSNKIQQMLDSYLFSISLIDLKAINRREGDAIRETIQRIYIRYVDSEKIGSADFIKELFQRYRLMSLVEDLQKEEAGELKSV